MSSETYLAEITELVGRIQSTQLEAIGRAAQCMADSIQAGRAVHLFGSGHAVLPVLDIFPRYGSFVGFHPLMDPRLMWFNIVGPGGARELLWLERRENYAANFLLSYNLDPRDTMLVFSHGGLNAAPLEVALAAKERGLMVVAVTSMANYRISTPTHSSGKKLADVADIVIDNCARHEDAVVPLAGRPEKVAASSTVGFTIVANALVAEVGRELNARNVPLSIFVSPTVVEVGADHNQQVFRDYAEFTRRLDDSVA